jgi:ClpP class serine protease
MHSPQFPPSYAHLNQLMMVHEPSMAAMPSVPVISSTMAQSSGQNVAILSYFGMVTPEANAQFSQFLDAALNDVSVCGVVMWVNSGGGYIKSTPELAQKIKGFTKPIEAVVEDVAASAMYYLIAGTKRITLTTPESMVGNIGVMISLVNMKETMKSFGIVTEDVYSSLSPAKNQEFTQALEGKPELLQKNLLDSTARAFIDFAESSRSLAANILEGPIYKAADGIKFKLADGMGSVSDAVASVSAMGKPKPTNKPNKNMKLKMLALFPFLASLFTEAKKEEDVDEATLLDSIGAELKAVCEQRDTVTAENKTLKAENEQLKADKTTLVAKADLDALQIKYDELAAKVPGAVPPPAKAKEADENPADNKEPDWYAAVSNLAHNQAADKLVRP